MNLQQLRYVQEVARRNLNVSDAANALFTSQPGVSKQIRLLEEELGVDIFVRHGKRLTGITDPGKQIIAIAERTLRDLANLKQIGDEFSKETEGSLSIATTHTQARYALPQAVKAFMERYPKVRLELHQGSPTQICEWVISGQSDIAIATEAIENYPEQLVILPCYQWNHSVIAPPKHPILKEKILTLEAVAAYPLVTYDFAFAGRSKINQAFVSRNLQPNVVLTALDADIIKAYVALGLGIGVVASMAFNPATDKGLRAMDASHLFSSSTTRIGIRKDGYLRGYAYVFMELFAPHLTRKVIEASLLGEGDDPGL
jgi:LysR family cys regulon transcriptional activator